MKFHYDPSAVLGKGLGHSECLPDSIAEHHSDFVTKYGCTPEVVSKLWDTIVIDNEDVTIEHLFLALNFYQNFPNPIDSQLFFEYNSSLTDRHGQETRYNTALVAHLLCGLFKTPFCVSCSLKYFHTMLLLLL